MSVNVPTTQDAFIEYCLRRLGHPVIRINISDDQATDRFLEALSYYQEYHYDATDTFYFKWQVQANNLPNAVYDATVLAGGTGYANGEALIFTPSAGGGSGAAGSILTDANGTIVSATLSNNGIGYALAPNVTIDTVSGTGGQVTCELGGFVQLPDNIIGVVDLFDLASSIITKDIFSVQYQIALNDIWSLSSYSMVPYYTTIMHLNLIQQLLVGKQPLRYQRHKNRLYVDMNWDRAGVGTWMIGTTYQKIDPAQFPAVYQDRWLIAYTTCLLKLQWGSNLQKFAGQALPGGMTFNADKIYEQAIQEKKQLEDAVVRDFSLPVAIYIG